jgi:hypothetical protein
MPTRTVHRLHSTRVSRSRHRAQRCRTTQNPEILPRVLHGIPNAPRPGEGRAAVASGLPAEQRLSPRDSSGGRPSSRVRTPRSVAFSSSKNATSSDAPSLGRRSGARRQPRRCLTRTGRGLARSGSIAQLRALSHHRPSGELRSGNRNRLGRCLAEPIRAPSRRRRPTMFSVRTPCRALMDIDSARDVTRPIAKMSSITTPWFCSCRRRARIAPPPARRWSGYRKARASSSLQPWVEPRPCPSWVCAL